MIKRAKNSLVYRIPFLYKLLLKRKTYPKGSIKSRNEDFNLIILTGLNQLNLLNEGLKSVLKNFKNIPKIIVYCDESLSKSTCENSLKWLSKSYFEIISKKECIDYHLNKGDLNLCKFANQNPMGLKLAAILMALNLNSPILYCDTDVLWFNDPSTYLKNLISNSKISLALSKDFQAAYDQKLISSAKLQALNEAPYYCAGILFIKKLNRQQLLTINHLLTFAVEDSNHFTEQSIFAYLNKNSEGFLLDELKFIIKLNDKFNLLPEKKNRFFC